MRQETLTHTAPQLQILYLSALPLAWLLDQPWFFSPKLSSLQVHIILINDIVTCQVFSARNLAFIFSSILSLPICTIVKPALSCFDSNYIAKLLHGSTHFLLSVRCLGSNGSCPTNKKSNLVLIQ